MQSINKKILLIFALAIAAILPFQAQAVAPTITPSTISSGTPKHDITTGTKPWKEKATEAKNAATAQKIEKLKDLGITLIENRINLLTNLKNRINNMGNISAAEKTALLADINKNIADLQTLGEKIKADTTVETLKTDIRSIFTTFKTYTIAAPKDLGESLTAQSNYILGRLTAIQNQIQRLLDQKKNAGIDTSSLESIMDQITAKLDDAKAQLAISDAKFKGMTPANTEAARTARAEGKAAMKAAKQDLKDAHALLKQVLAQLKGLSPSPNASTSPSPSPTPTPETSPSGTE